MRVGQYSLAYPIPKFHSLSIDEFRERVIYEVWCMSNQLLATERDIALARICKGKISPVMTHAMGPQVEAKKAYG